MNGMYQRALLLIVLFLTSCSGGAIDDLRGRKVNSSSAESSEFAINGNSPKHVYIVCFYGKNDHDGLAKKKCDEMLKACKDRYGEKYCHVKRNPTEGAVAKIPDDSIVIVVTHTTPLPKSPDLVPNTDCTIDIWNSNVSPPMVAKCGAPIVWYGCYGAQVAAECPNVIPLQDTPMVLDSRKPEVACRFKATLLCMEELTAAGLPITQESVGACVKRKVIDLTNAQDPTCRQSNASGSGSGSRR